MSQVVIWTLWVLKFVLGMQVRLLSIRLVQNGWIQPRKEQRKNGRKEGRVRFLAAIEVEVVREKHRVGQEGKTKRCQEGRNVMEMLLRTYLLSVLCALCTWVGSRQLLVRNDSCSGIHTATTVPAKIRASLDFNGRREQFNTEGRCKRPGSFGRKR